MEKRQKWAGWILIAIILIITVTALGVNTLADAGDKNSSSIQQYEAELRAFFPETQGFEQVDEGEGGFIIRATGNPESYAVQQVVQGYAGPVEVIAALDASGVIRGIRVGGSGFKETEGLGAKAKEPAFTEQFAGQTAPVTLGQEVDAISGATVTSQAVVDAVNLAFSRLQKASLISTLPTIRPENGDSSGMTANASAIGYGGPVLVRLTLDDQGRISALDVGGARFAETEGVGSRVREEAFTRQFLALTPPLTLNKDVDAISGATISSQAVVDAVNDAYAFLTQNNAPADTN